MATPPALVALMKHSAVVKRHLGFSFTNQTFTTVATLPCYIDASKGDQSPPTLTAYIGLTTAAPVRQGDYFDLAGPLGEWPTKWSLGNVQTFWDENGEYWCQQADLDCPVAPCRVEVPATVPDSEARFTGWTDSFGFDGGIRPLSVSEQRRAAQDGLQINLYCRYPSAVVVKLGHRIRVTSGAYTGTYEVITLEQHPDANTANLRRYEPAGTPV